ncbi:radical SAM protein [Thermus sp.]|uniref:radical SAM protein n=1 Tax=Thermus sp. TaxID=275 RepID=UPI003325124E
MKSGLCPEDCAYCAQSARWATSAPRYPLLTPEAILAQAEEARQSGAARFCLVSATRSPSPRLLRRIEEVAPKIKAMGLELCTSLGLLTEEMARRLKEAGVDYYNHNLNTSQSRYPQIATTHRYEDRLKTLAAARKAGLKLCSGVLLGWGRRWKKPWRWPLPSAGWARKACPSTSSSPSPERP